MDYRKFGSTFVVRIDRGEEVVTELLSLAEKENIQLASVEGIGAAEKVVAGLYNVEKQQYTKTEYNEPMEITSILGTITRMNGTPYLHLHIACGREDGTVIGGHLTSAVIGGTGEIVIREIDGNVGRKKDDITGTGLNLFDFSLQIN